jgi:23S rRNA (adenine2503-C2)-methyltransferase
MTEPTVPFPGLPVAPPARDPRPGVSGLETSELAALLGAMGEPAFRAQQVGDAVWRSDSASWDAVTTLSRPLRAGLAERLRFDTVAETDLRLADNDATEKALHRLSDGRLVESVLMHYPARGERRERNTLCISSQAGCAVGCPFCATGELGFERDLDVAEIVDQVRHARRRLMARGRHLTNLVFMGMGEPLLNLDAVIRAALVLTDGDRFGLGSRHITISTSGVVPGIERLTALAPQWTLAVSLHAARDSLRDLLVPLNRRWPVRAVVAAAAAYASATGRRVSYEYVMIDGLNDTAADADALARLLAGSGSHVNCIPMNPVAHTPWQASGPDRIEAFAGRLRAAGIGVTIRRNRGQEVGAACGQLAAERSAEPTAVAVARRRERLVAASAAALARERSQEPAIAGLASASHAPPTDRVVARAGTPPTRVTGPGAPRPVTARTNAPRGTVGRGDAPRGTAPRPSEPRPTPRQDAIRSTRPQHPGTPRPGTTSRPASGRRPPGPPNRGGG